MNDLRYQQKNVSKVNSKNTIRNELVNILIAKIIGIELIN